MGFESFGSLTTQQNGQAELNENKKKKLEKDYEKSKKSKAERRKKNRERKKDQKQDDLQQQIDSQQEELKQALGKPTHSFLLNGDSTTNGHSNDVDMTADDDDLKNIEYVYTNMEDQDSILAPGRHVAEFKHIFEHFVTPTALDKQRKEEEKKFKDAPTDVFAKAAQDNEEDDDEKDGEKKLSKKQRKLLARMKIFELKMNVRRPDLVEAWDATSRDPMFLMELKMVRNSVPVPRHWNQKRRYLQYKRGIHKVPFKLPDFIEATGISRVREQTSDKNMSMKQKIRQRLQPKMGKVEIDYGVLHDAFFKNQKKPKLTMHGDLYYEGKEYEIRMRGYKPGRLSPELRVALGIPENSPPPWLINMQRYGPPPAYPNLKIPGVNAPIPETITYGFGRLFTDEKGFTVYADPHGLNKAIYQRRQNRQPYWGIVKDVADEEEEEEESEEEESEPEDEGIGRAHLGLVMEDEEYAEHRPEEPSRVSYDELMSGAKSMVGSKSQVAKPPPPSEARPLYQILEEVKSTVKGNELYSSEHGYKMGGPQGAQMAVPEPEINIQKNLGDQTKIQKSKEDDKKKKKDKEDKYSMKF